MATYLLEQYDKTDDMIFNVDLKDLIENSSEY
jgi:hypothetical protein